MNPAPLTLRELNWMTRGRLEHDWNLASQILSALAGVGGESIPPEKFHPFRKRKKRKRKEMISVQRLCEITGRQPKIK